jgi:hypothetical protein
MKLTPWNKVIEKSIIVQLVKKFTSFYGSRVHKNPPVDPILTHFNSVHALKFYFLIYFNIIIPSTSRSSKWSRPFRFSD